jgi:hypothetical protein
LRITAPTALDGKFIFKGTTLAEQAVVSRADGRSTWELRFQAPITGAFTITVEDQRDVPALTAGTPLPLTIEPLTILDATRVSHVCAVAREGTVEVSAMANGLEVVAPSDLPAGLHTQGVVAGFQGTTSVALALSLVRHDLVALADGAVTAARYLAVISEERLLRVQGYLVLSTRSRPWLELRLPVGAELLEVAVDRHQSRPSRRSDGSVVIPLGDGTGLRTQVVAFVYEQKLGDQPLGSWGSIGLTLPTLGGSTQADTTARPLPVGPVSCELFLPSDLTTCGWHGDLSLNEEGIPLWTLLLARLNGNEQELQRGQARELPPLNDGIGLTVPISLSGHGHHLQRLGDGGTVNMRFMSQGLLNLIALAALVIGGLAMWLARRRTDVLAGIIISAAVLVAAVSAPWLIVVGGFAVGVFVILDLLLIMGALAKYRVRRALPQVVTADPWLEKAKPMPVKVESSAPMHELKATEVPPVSPEKADTGNAETKPNDDKPAEPRP